MADERNNNKALFPLLGNCVWVYSRKCDTNIALQVIQQVVKSKLLTCLKETVENSMTTSPTHFSTKYLFPYVPKNMSSSINV